jgi:hypothetical protein
MVKYEKKTKNKKNLKLKQKRDFKNQYITSNNSKGIVFYAVC